MSSLPRRLILLALVSFVLAPATAHAAGVAPAFDLSSPSGAPFPSDRYTVADCDAAHRAARRPAEARLHGRGRPTAPTSTCSTRSTASTSSRGSRSPSRARSTWPASRAPTSSSSGSPTARVTGINQIVWESPANTLHAESDQLLDQHTTLPARRHDRRQGRRRRPDRRLVVPPGSELRPRQGRRRQGLSQGADRGAQPLAPRRRRQGGRRGREPLHDAERDDAARAGARADQGLDPGRRPTSCSVTLGERTVFPLASITGITFSPADHDAAVLRQLHGRDPGALALPGRGRDRRLRRVRRRPTTRMRQSSFPRSARRRECLPSRGRTGSTSTSSSPPAPPPLAAGRWRSSGTASATTRTRARSSSPLRWRIAASPRSRSTSSVTAAARSGR